MQQPDTPPTYSLEAEKSALGAVLVDNAALESITGIISQEDLHNPAHRHIYAAMLELNQAKSPIDFTTLLNSLKTGGQLEEAGGAPYLLELVDYVPTAANVAYYAKIIRTHAVQRSLAGVGQVITGRIRQGHDPATVIDETRRSLDKLAGELDGAHGVNAADLISFDGRATAYQQFVSRVNKFRFTTGFRDLDKELRGVAPGELLTIIAYSGTFKSALLQFLLLRSARDTGLLSLFFSLEMPAAKLFEREVAMTSGINGYTCEYRWRNEPVEANALQLAARDGGGKNMLVCERPGLTIDQIGRYIDAAKRNHGEIGVVGIDYLGLMQAPGKTLFERTAYLGPELKNLAKSKNVPLLVLAQVNRESVKNNAEIEAHSAKGGGDVEASADFMLGMQQTKQGQLIMKVLKNRNGAAGQVWEVQLDRPSLQFTGLIPYEPTRQATNQNIDF
ncbi:MAG: replicative DNA helicase [Trichlorobacter sp.]|uniref:replicative DNA helicase n=1 Tax=Trichlorobacter sp. TaxID=2911007 RepID=UPI002564B31D|nr:replicative DNA helicase [Trichlorobacter sp.]MDK9718416.1 replicative DNA helicase [Trichlorobacter sp.]